MPVGAERLFLFQHAADDGQRVIGRAASAQQFQRLDAWISAVKQAQHG